jgi:ABC-2 type transport system permease protein
METLRGFVPFAYTDDALKTVFGLSTGTTPLEILVYPTIICAVLAFAVCLTAPRLLSQRL